MDNKKKRSWTRLLVVLKLIIYIMEKTSKFEGPQSKSLKLSLDVLDLMIKTETKKVLGVFNDCFLRNLVGGVTAFLISLAF